MPDGNTDGSEFGMLLSKVAQILGIEQSKVEEAFVKAQSELRERLRLGHPAGLAQIGELLSGSDQATAIPKLL